MKEEARQTFTITPDACYYIADVTVDGVSYGPITSYTFTNVSAPHTITATFAGQPCISVNPTSYNFGSVNINSSSAHKTFTVSNVGHGNLVLGTLSLTGTNPGQFSKQNDTCSGQTLPPSSNCSAQIKFSPTSTGTKTANLSITSNDVQTPTINASLSGTGVCLDPVRVGVGSPPTYSYYSDLQEAYDNAPVGQAVVIQSQRITFTEENLLINRPNVTVTLEGGYNCDYTSYSGNVTTLKGMIQTSAGTLTIGNFILVQ